MWRCEIDDGGINESTWFINQARMTLMCVSLGRPECGWRGWLGSDDETKIYLCNKRELSRYDNQMCHYLN